MSRSSNLLLGAALVLGVVLLGIGLGLLGSRGPSPRIPPPEAPPESSPASSPLAANPGTPQPSAPTPEQIVPDLQNPELSMTSTSATNLVFNWEDRVDQILTGDGDTADKAKHMLDLFPRLPQEGQQEVAQHLSNLVSDQDYPELAKLLSDTNLAAPVLDVFFGDTLNRPNSVKLPALLQVARQPQHPKAAEAKEVLALFLDDDYGSDWDKWQAAVDQWLKNNPD